MRKVIIAEFVEHIADANVDEGEFTIGITEDFPSKILDPIFYACCPRIDDYYYAVFTIALDELVAPAAG